MCLYAAVLHTLQSCLILQALASMHCINLLSSPHRIHKRLAHTGTRQQQQQFVLHQALITCGHSQVSSYRRAQGVQPSLSQTGIRRQLPGNPRCQSCSSAVPIRHRLLPAHGRVHAAMDAGLQGILLASSLVGNTRWGGGIVEGIRVE